MPFEEAAVRCCTKGESCDTSKKGDTDLPATFGERTTDQHNETDYFVSPELNQIEDQGDELHLAERITMGKFRDSAQRLSPPPPKRHSITKAKRRGLPARFLPLLKSRFPLILEGMEVHFSPEQEAQLARIATNAGTAAEQLVKDVVLRLLEGETHVRPAAPELPVWHLGGVGALHRRDIYDDAR